MLFVYLPAERTGESCEHRAVQAAHRCQPRGCDLIHGTAAGSGRPDIIRPGDSRQDPFRVGWVTVEDQHTPEAVGWRIMCHSRTPSRLVFGQAQSLPSSGAAGPLSREDIPKWRQLADLIRDRIASGEYPPRTAIPSEHQLVAETGLSRSTVQKTLKALRADGVVYSVHGLGTFVSEH